MTLRKRFGLSAAEKSEVWCRWKAGDSLHTIGAPSARSIPLFAVWCHVTAGFVPAVRRRALLASGSLIRDLATGLERAVSTVSREIARHSGRPEYRANQADDAAWESALRPKRCLLAMQVRLPKVVARKLMLDWSPEQISG